MQEGEFFQTFALLTAMKYGMVGTAVYIANLIEVSDIEKRDRLHHSY